MGDFCMPSLGADMEAGTVLEWRVAVGDTVRKGDIVAVVDTEKSTIDVEVFEDGVVDEILVPTDREVAVGTPLARIRTGAPAEPPAPEVPATPEAPESPAAPEPPARPAAPAAPEARPRPRPRRPRAPRRPTEPAAAPTRGHVRSSPLARRRAAERSLDIAALDGSGPGGAVVAADVERAAGDGHAPPAAGPAPEAPEAPHATRAPRRTPQEAMRQATGRLMARSKREIPHYYLGTTVDFANAHDWLTRANADRPPATRLLPGALLLKATALAARRVPELNGTYDRGFVPATTVDLGVAVSLRGGGLVAPAIPDADTLGVDEFMAALRDLVQRARSGRLRSSDVAGGTITVTNLGDQGAEEVQGVIYRPQVALVGFGRVVERPWAVDGMLCVRPVVRATLAGDHRASDGHMGSRFLAMVDHLLQTPEDL